MHEIAQLGLAHQRYGDPTPFGIRGADRLLHLYIIGQTGTGKSTLLANLIRQDIQAGRGCCLIDPHGDLAESLLQSEHPTLIYWDVADPTCPFGYNPISRVSEAHRPLVASGLIETLKKQWPDAWGARMEHLLRYAILALLEQEHVDLRDIIKLFVFKGYRRQVIEHLSDPQVRAFWKFEYPNLHQFSQGDGISPITNKLGAFLSHPVVRKAVCEPAKPIRFRQCLDGGQMVIVNLAKGRLGADIASVLGGLVSASIMNAALTRHDTPTNQRRPFYLYVDEFHNFTTKSFAGLLSEARKYGLGLILAHQHLSQTDTEVRDAIIGNVGTMVVFRVGANDAGFFERVLPPFSAHDLSNQPNFRSTVHLINDGERLKPFTASMQPPYDLAA